MSMKDYYEAKSTGIADMSNPSAVHGLIARQTQEAASDRARLSRRGGGTGGQTTHPVVWLFGLIGAFVGGVLQPWGMSWFGGLFFGFIICGMLAGVLMKYRAGKIILTVVGLGFFGLMGFAIAMAG